MTTQFITEYLDNKIKLNENYIVCTFYDFRVKNNRSEEDIKDLWKFGKIRLENMGYRVFITGDKFVYENCNRTVQDNELMIAIKEEIEKNTDKKDSKKRRKIGGGKSDK